MILESAGGDELSGNLRGPIETVPEPDVVLALVPVSSSGL